MKASIFIFVTTILRGASPDHGCEPSPGAGHVALETGQEIATRDGMAELPLTQGSFLRLGAGSVLRLKSAQATRVHLWLKQGRAIVEILTPQPSILIEQSGISAVMQKPGLYGFDTRRGEIVAWSGEARLSKEGKQIVAGPGFAVKTRRFHPVRVTPNPTDPLLAWSNLCSEQVSTESGAGAGLFGWPYYSRGYVPDSIPVHHGDNYLYGPPVIQTPGIPPPATPEYTRPAPTLPLTAPGVPQFPNNRF